MADGRRNSQGQHRGTEKRGVWPQPLNALQISMDLLSQDKKKGDLLQSTNRRIYFVSVSHSFPIVQLIYLKKKGVLMETVVLLSLFLKCTWGFRSSSIIDKLKDQVMENQMFVFFLMKNSYMLMNSRANFTIWTTCILIVFFCFFFLPLQINNGNCSSVPNFLGG